MARSLFFPIALSILLGACTTAPDDVEPTAASAQAYDESTADDHHDHGSDGGSTETVDVAPNDPVAAVVGRGCSTKVVRGLATQLVEEIGCMKPGSMRRLDGTDGLALGNAVFPYLQTSAATALAAAQKMRGVTMAINSALRALPEQYLLYRWYRDKRCGIALAARPGSSNHESGLAVDIQDNASWRSAMTSQNYAWLGASDPVHFDYRGTGTIEMKGLSVLAFQKLWNRNHASDGIAEDGDYGPETEKRLAQAPVGGFPKGASCVVQSGP